MKLDGRDWKLLGEIIRKGPDPYDAVSTYALDRLLARGLILGRPGVGRWLYEATVFGRTHYRDQGSK